MEVVAAYRYPIKSMQGQELSQARVGPVGIVGDRSHALRDDATGVWRTKADDATKIERLDDTANPGDNTVNGEAPLSRDMAALMIDAIHTLEARSKARERAAVLSEREKEVLAFVARGARNREIAEELAISEFTVKRHMQNILQKLDVPSRRAAAAFYVSAYRDQPVAEGSSA